jgi:outer membrane protein assembly factor BamB
MKNVIIIKLNTLRQRYLLVLMLVSCFQWGTAQQISEWRGPDRTGIYNETNLLKSWPVEGPNEILTIESVGDGFVSPVLNEDRIYITGAFDSILNIQCYDLAGKKIWQTPLGKEWMKNYPGSRSPITVADKHIYVGSGYGNLYCIDKVSGKLIWSKDLERDFNGVLPLHAHSEAPLVEGDKVFWVPGGIKYNVVAINRFTGVLLWSSKGLGEPSGYNSPKLIKLPERSVMVTASSYHLMGFDTKDGTMLWSHAMDNTPLLKRAPGIGDTHCNTVLYENGAIYYAFGDGNCGVKLELSADGAKIKELWRNKSLDTYMGGVLKSGNYLYGGSTSKPVLLSVNATTGETTDSLRIGTGAIIAADGMLYYYTEKGDMILLKYSNGDITEVSRFRIIKGNGQHFSHPVVYKGVLYLRHGRVLQASNIKQT